MPVATPSYPRPLQSSHSLSKLPQDDLTPAIGTEFPSSVSLRALLDDRQAIRDLAILVSQRGVVFFREQELTPAEQVRLVDLLGQETGRPKESSLHIHPLTSTTDELGAVFKITADFNEAGNKLLSNVSTKASNLWHSDITFEEYPSDYACLQIRELPKTGGDTLWASSYEAYSRLSPSMQAYLETLTATHTAHSFLETAARDDITFREPRGHPDNKGQGLSAVHPVVRTNPVTGWKGLFVNRFFTKRINQLTVDESDHLLAYLFGLVSENHDLHVRFRWTANSVALWDNRSTEHCATNNYGRQARWGDRVVSVGEKPYLDPSSVSRAEALGEQDE